MKSILIFVATIGTAVLFSLIPVQTSTSQDSTVPVVELANPIPADVLPDSLQSAVDTLNFLKLEFNIKLDSLQTSVANLKAEKNNLTFYKTTYQPPVAVLEIPLENKSLLVQYDSARRRFRTLKTVYQ